MSDQAKDPMVALYAALAAAQGLFQPIAKNRTVTIQTTKGGKYVFRFADLQAITDATRPALSANGLSVIHPLHTDENGKTYQQTILMHRDGGRVFSQLSIPSPDKFSDPKEFGAASSYLRRYALSSLLGVAADDDLDEGADDGAGRTHQGGQRGLPNATGQGKPLDSALQDQAKAEAMKGMAEYAKWFAAIGADGRVALGNAAHKDFKAIAEKADRDREGAPA